MTTLAETPHLEVADRRLRMGILMSAITLMLVVAWTVSPITLRFAILLVGMTTCVYALFNLIIFRYRRKLAT